MAVKKHVVIAIPAYTWTVQLATMRSILHDVLALTQRGDWVSFLDESGSSDIADARAIIVEQFLDGGGTHLVCVDSDVCWERGALVRLVDAPVDFVAGVYPKRQDPIEFPVQYIPGPLQAVDGLLEVEAVQGGFVRLTRPMLKQMGEAHPGLKVQSSRSPKGSMHMLYDRVILEDGTKIGEDFAFCHRWRAMGGKVWIDPEINLGHIGNKMFAGRLGDWLRERME